MTTFLIISKNKLFANKHATELATQQQIHKQDITILETEGSIGIEDIRMFQKQIMLKPMRGENKAVIIKDAHTLTTEAQNALLKTLEEPPNHTYIYLLAENSHSLLPTILSRASIMVLEEDSQFNEQALEEIEQQVTDIFSASIGDKLKLAEILAADKTTAIIWLEKALYILRKHMLEHVEKAPTYIPAIEAIQKNHGIIKSTNINVRLALENLFLQI